MIIPEPAVKAVVVNCVFTSLAFLFVLFRVLTRTFILKNVGADDVLIILSVVSSDHGRPLSVPKEAIPDIISHSWPQ